MDINIKGCDNMYCGSPLTVPLVGDDGKEKKRTIYNHKKIIVVFLLMFKHGFASFSKIFNRLMILCN